MSDYRTAEAVPVTTIPLKKVDASRLLRTFFVLLAVLLGGTLGGTAVISNVLGRETVAIVLPLYVIAVVVFALVFGYRRLHGINELHFYLDVGESFLRLRAPNGDGVADTRTGDLSFERCTYIRRTKSSAYVRPGWRMKHPLGDHLVGTLYPQDAFENVPRDERIPDFELDRAQFDAFKARVDALATET